MRSLYDPEERTRLAPRLLPGETAHWLERDGAMIHWMRRRAPAGAEDVRGTLVLVHGAASNASRWEEFVETAPLCRSRETIRLNLRGHASSSCSKRASLEIWSDDLEGMLAAAGVEHPVLVGHSLGAHVVMHLAARRPGLASGLVLLDPLVSAALSQRALNMQRRRPWVRLLEALARAVNACGVHRRLQPQDLRAMDARAREKIARGGRELEDFVREYSSPWADLRYIHAACYLRDMLEAARRSPAPGRLTAPTLVIAASSGVYTDPALLAQWADRLPQGEVRTVQCLHWPLTECPHQVSRVIEEWLQKNAVGPERPAAGA